MGCGKRKKSRILVWFCFCFFFFVFKHPSVIILFKLATQLNLACHILLEFCPKFLVCALLAQLMPKEPRSKLYTSDCNQMAALTVHRFWQWWLQWDMYHSTLLRMSAAICLLAGWVKIIFKCIGSSLVLNIIGIWEIFILFPVLVTVVSIKQEVKETLPYIDYNLCFNGYTGIC